MRAIEREESFAGTAMPKPSGSVSASTGKTLAESAGELAGAAMPTVSALGVGLQGMGAEVSALSGASMPSSRYALKFQEAFERARRLGGEAVGRVQEFFESRGVSDEGVVRFTDAVSRAETKIRQFVPGLSRPAPEVTTATLSAPGLESLEVPRFNVQFKVSDLDPAARRAIGDFGGSALDLAEALDESGPSRREPARREKSYYRGAPLETAPTELRIFDGRGVFEERREPEQTISRNEERRRETTVPSSFDRMMSLADRVRNGDARLERQLRLVDARYSEQLEDLMQRYDGSPDAERQKERLLQARRYFAEALRHGGAEVNGAAAKVSLALPDTAEVRGEESLSRLPRFLRIWARRESRSAA